MMASRSFNAQSRRAKLDNILRGAPIIPVITIERVEDAVPLARALVAGGLVALEITLRTPAAPEAAAAIAAALPEAIIGLGTVLTPKDLETARALGARFALSPGATTELLDAAAADELPFIPGVQTSSELMAALARGFDVVKFFPAVPAGGTAALKALAGPFPQVGFARLVESVRTTSPTGWPSVASSRSVARGWYPRPTSALATGQQLAHEHGVPARKSRARLSARRFARRPSNIGDERDCAALQPGPSGAQCRGWLVIKNIISSMCEDAILVRRSRFFPKQR